MFGDFDRVNCNILTIGGHRLIVDGKINPFFLSTSKTKTNIGIFLRKDINAGQIRLEVSNSVDLYRDNELVATLMHANTEIGYTHMLASGIQYILTAEENAILIVDTSKYYGWSPNASGIRKFLLTKK